MGVSEPQLATRLAMHYTWGGGVGYLWQHESKLGVLWVCLPSWSTSRCQEWDFGTEELAIRWWEDVVRSHERAHPKEIVIKEPAHV